MASSRSGIRECYTPTLGCSFARYKQGVRSIGWRWQYHDKTHLEDTAESVCVVGVDIVCPPVVLDGFAGIAEAVSVDLLSQGGT